MKQTLALRMGQQLSMTPQLQQAIRLMQLSALELKAEVRQAIESNPMLDLLDDEDDLELPDDDGEDPLVAEADDQGEEAEFEDDEFRDRSDEVDSDAEFAAADELSGPVEEIPDELPVDVSWDDLYQGPRTVDRGPSADPGNPIEELNSSAETLHDHLLEQLDLARLSDRDRLAATTVIGNIDDDGMLRATTAELLDGMDPLTDYGADEMEALVKLVQTFDPPGVGARDLAHCLQLQLEQLPGDTPWRDVAIALVRDHFSLLANRDFATLARRVRLADDELVEAMTLIRTLNPRPGATIGPSGIEYIEPDVLVRKRSGRWTVELNRDTAPRVRINEDYAALIRRADSSSDNVYLKNNLQEARWFLKNLDYRNETLLKVAAKIVERQVGFLEHGEEAMQPLVLADIAHAVDRHESTISRVTTRKYMETPRGVFELKYFFSSHVGTVNGGEVSSTAIRALIKKLTAQENPRKPLSDSKIAAVLKERDIKVARRTVAKYRESLAIPPSNERRRLV